MKSQILIIDEDQKTWLDIKPYLIERHYDLLITNNTTKVTDFLENNSVQLIILGDLTHEIHTLELLKSIKNKSHDLPIIIVSNQLESLEKTVFLEIGAVDFVSKPFENREFMARIKAHLRQIHETENRMRKEMEISSVREKSIFCFGNWILDQNKNEVLYQNGIPIDLTTGEYILLEALLLSNGKIVSREKLFNLTHREKFQNFDRAVDIQIARIRKKLKENPRHPKYIKTVRGAGYMLDAKVEKAG